MAQQVKSFTEDYKQVGLLLTELSGKIQSDLSVDTTKLPPPDQHMEELKQLEETRAKLYDAFRKIENLLVFAKKRKEIFDLLKDSPALQESILLEMTRLGIIEG